jgi:hypothetical protein
MARESQGEGQAGQREQSDLEAIRDLAAYNARAPLNNDKQLLLFLQSWWSKTYNRPLKDPLLLTYSIDELIYEFYDKIERHQAEVEQLNSDSDKIELDKDKSVLDWAEQEEQRELDKLKQDTAKQSAEVNAPATAPADIAWMDEQILKEKAVHGDSFGEDINEQF